MAKKNRKAARRRRKEQKKQFIQKNNWNQEMKKALEEYHQQFVHPAAPVPPTPPARRRDVFAYDINMYNPATIRAGKRIPREDALVEYKRLRQIALNRLKSLAIEGYKGTKTYQNWSKNLSKYPENPDERQLIYGLPEFATYLSQLTSTPEGMRKRQEKIAERTGMSVTQVQKYEDFFAVARDYMAEALFSSKKVMNVVDYMEEEGIDEQRFLEIYQKWSNHEPTEKKGNKKPTNSLVITKV